jgi:hypothetical protein
MIACHLAWDPAVFLGGLRILPRAPRKHRIPSATASPEPSEGNPRTYTLYDGNGVRIGTIAEVSTTPKLGCNQPTILLSRQLGEM